MKIFATILLLTGIFGPQFAIAGDVPLSAIEGRWGRNNCNMYIHTIRFSANKQFLQFTDEEKTYYYYIAGITERGYKVVMLPEDRFDSKGNPVFWYIVFHNNNSFAWLRSDRESGDLRGPVVRCK